jgi:hypothetical protein
MNFEDEGSRVFLGMLCRDRDGTYKAQSLYIQGKEASSMRIEDKGAFTVPYQDIIYRLSCQRDY